MIERLHAHENQPNKCYLFSNKVTYLVTHPKLSTYVCVHWHQLHRHLNSYTYKQLKFMNSEQAVKFLAVSYLSWKSEEKKEQIETLYTLHTPNRLLIKPIWSINSSTSTIEAILKVPFEIWGKRKISIFWWNSKDCMILQYFTLLFFYEIQKIAWFSNILLSCFFAVQIPSNTSISE